MTNSLTKATHVIRGVKDTSEVFSSNTKMEDTGKAGAQHAVFDMVDNEAFELPPAPRKSKEVLPQEAKPVKAEASKETVKPKDGQPKKPDDLVATVSAVDAEVFAALSSKYPAATCLQDLNFQDFKAKIIEARAKKNLAAEKANPAQPGKIEPIFKTLTDEIKSLQLSQSTYDQYIKAVTSCYQRIILDVTSELKSSEKNQAQRLSLLEDAIRDLQSEKRHNSSLEGLVLPFIALVWVVVTSISSLLTVAATPKSWFVAAERISEYENGTLYAGLGGLLVLFSFATWLNRKSQRLGTTKGRIGSRSSARRRLAPELQESPGPDRHFTPILEEDADATFSNVDKD